jgi:hypothetical protein
MVINVILAKKNKQRSDAHQLVKETYLQKFNVNIDHLHELHPEKFHSDTLVAYSNESEEILGTMSLIYPNRKGGFQCESLFGFDLSGLNFAANKYVEVGSFATSEKAKKNPAVVISLFLGAIQHLQNKKISGWTATVKNDVFDFLNKISLPMKCINQSPKLHENDPLNSYVGQPSALHLFDVTLSETKISFQRFEGFLSKELIKLYL